MADQQPLSPFKFDEWLSDNEMKFVSKTPEGNVLVERPDGQVSPIKMDKVYEDLAKESGRSVDELKKHPVQYNSPLSPVNTSPVALMDRAAVKSFSDANKKGAVKFLKNKFEGVEYNPDEGLVVKDKGVWHRVDPNLLGGGDAWTASEIVKDVIVDNADIALNVAATAKGATVGGGIGAVLGAAAGSAVPGIGTVAGLYAGGLAGSVVGAGVAGLTSALSRTTFGRFIGTYEATPEEQMQDVIWETLFSMGGQAAPAAARMTGDMVVKSGKWLGSKASPAVQDTIANVYGAITGVGKASMQVFMDAPGKMWGRTKQLITEAAEEMKGVIPSYEGLLEFAKKRNLDTFRTLTKEASAALPQKYGKILGELGEEAEKKGWQTSGTEMAEAMVNGMQDAGLGQFVPKISKSGAKVRAKMGAAGVDLPNPKIDLQKGSIEFRPYSTMEAQTLLRTGARETAEAMSPEELKIIQPIVEEVLALGQQGAYKGRAGINALTKLQSRLNDLKDLAYAPGATAKMKRLTEIVTNSYEDVLSKSFDDVGMGAKYAERAELYAQYGNAVQRARHANSSPEALETFYNQAIEGGGRKLTPGEYVRELVDLTEERGQQLYESMQVTNAAAKFSAMIPRLGVMKQWGGIGFPVAAGTAAKYLGVANPGMGTAALAMSQMSPKALAGQAALASGAKNLVQKGLPYALKGMDFVKSRTPKQLQELVQNDRAFGAFIGSMVGAHQREDQDTQALLQQSGALP